ncbi:MAG: phosphoglycerate kinase [Flavobacteriales bacterium]|nr:phosphoglycerate kinase [Flavobacteriales bacterium]
MKTINDFNFAGKKAIARVDFNVPYDENFNITDDNRIQAVVPTVKKILADGGSVILMSHLGRPDGKVQDKYSLKHIVGHVSEVLGVPVKFASDCIGAPAKEAAAALKPGEVLLLENLRFHAEEEKGDEGFAKELASLADIYVNDAFGTAHRAHASTAVIAKYMGANKCFGLLMAKEVESIKKVLENGEHPVTAILGGSKVSSKLPIIYKMLESVDNLIIGGGMAYTFIKAMGGKIGNSLQEPEYMEISLEIMKKAKERGVNIYLTKDAVTTQEFSDTCPTKVFDADKIEDGWGAMDISEKTMAYFGDVIKNSKTILWNGPMGVFEMDKYATGTIAMAKAIEEATKKGSFSLVGGGDSVAAVKKFGFEHKVSYVSTGGGAMLESLEGKILPGIAAIEE